MVSLPAESIVRDPSITYYLKSEQWAKLVREAEHAHFGAHVATKVWKPNTATIAVVQWPRRPNDHAGTGKPDYVWCVCFNVESAKPRPLDHVGVAVMNSDYELLCEGGGSVLWPIDPNIGVSRLVEQFEQSEAAQQSSLHSFVASLQVDGDGPDRADFPFPWLLHPHASKTKEIKSFYTRIFLASLQPLRRPAQKDQRAKMCSEFLKLPDDQLGDVSHPRRKRGKQRAVPCPFAILSDDVAEDLVVQLAISYINTPAYGAHRNWTALRAVSVAFRDAANLAATQFIETAHSRIRSVEDFDDTHTIARLREHVLPTGLDVWRMVKAAAFGGLSGYDSRTALLAYMRLRGNMKWDERVPEAPPSPALNGECDKCKLVSMYLMHGPLHAVVTMHQQGLVHGTRSQAPLCPRVCMSMKVEPWRVRYMAMHGWEGAESVDME